MTKNNTARHNAKIATGITTENKGSYYCDNIKKAINQSFDGRIGEAAIVIDKSQDAQLTNYFNGGRGTMLMASRKTGIERASICRWVAKARKMQHRIWRVGYDFCPISKDKAQFYTTNPVIAANWFLKLLREGDILFDGIRPPADAGRWISEVSEYLATGNQPRTSTLKAEEWGSIINAITNYLEGRQ